MTDREIVRARRRRRGLFAALLVLGVASIGTGAFSLAMFTSAATLDGNAFTAGTINLTATPATALLTASAMMPGDSVAATLVMANPGTSQLRYAMSSTSTNADGKGLRDVLTLTVKTLGTSCAAFNGTTLYTGPLGAATAAFGDSTAGAQAGDRTLDAGTSETLCFSASVPIGTGNAYQGAASTTTFTFAAEQTAHNP